MDSNIYVAKVINTSELVESSSSTNAKQIASIDVVSNLSTIGSDENLKILSNDYENIKSRIEADSLVIVTSQQQQQQQQQLFDHDLSVDFHDSLDGSVSDIYDDNDVDDARSDTSGSSTSTESLIERSRKYLTDEAGIIILKTKKLPRQKDNFNIILNFDIDGTNKLGQKLKIENLHQHSSIEGSEEAIRNYLETQQKFAAIDSNFNKNNNFNNAISDQSIIKGINVVASNPDVDVKVISTIGGQQQDRLVDNSIINTINSNQPSVNVIVSSLSGGTSVLNTSTDTSLPINVIKYQDINVDRDDSSGRSVLKDSQQNENFVIGSVGVPQIGVRVDNSGQSSIVTDKNSYQIPFISGGDYKVSSGGDAFVSTATVLKDSQQNENFVIGSVGVPQIGVKVDASGQSSIIVDRNFNQIPFTSGGDFKISSDGDVFTSTSTNKGVDQSIYGQSTSIYNIVSSKPADANIYTSVSSNQPSVTVISSSGFDKDNSVTDSNAGLSGLNIANVITSVNSGQPILINSTTSSVYANDNSGAVNVTIGQSDLGTNVVTTTKPSVNNVIKTTIISDSGISSNQDQSKVTIGQTIPTSSTITISGQQPSTSANLITSIISGQPIDSLHSIGVSSGGINTSSTSTISGRPDISENNSISQKIDENNFNWNSIVYGNQQHQQQQQQQKQQSDTKINDSNLKNSQMDSLNAQIGRMDNIARIVGDSLRQNTLNDKENSYRRNLADLNNTSQQGVNLSSSFGNNLPFLIASGDNLTGIGSEGFEIEENIDEGKLVLYITEKQLLQLLKQRAVLVPNKKKLLLDDKSDGKKVFLLDQTSDGSVNKTLVWEQQQQNQHHHQQQQHQQTSHEGRTSPYKHVDVFVKTQNSQTVPLPNILNQNTTYDQRSESNKVIFQTSANAEEPQLIRPTRVITEIRKTVISPSEFERELQKQRVELSDQYKSTFSTYSVKDAASSVQQTIISSPAGTEYTIPLKSTSKNYENVQLVSKSDDTQYISEFIPAKSTINDSTLLIKSGQQTDYNQEYLKKTQENTSYFSSSNQPSYGETNNNLVTLQPVNIQQINSSTSTYQPSSFYSSKDDNSTITQQARFETYSSSGGNNYANASQSTSTQPIYNYNDSSSRKESITKPSFFSSEYSELKPTQPVVSSNEFTFTSQPSSINYNIKSSDQLSLNQSTAVDYNYNKASQVSNNNILISNNEPTVHTFSSNTQQDVAKKQTQSVASSNEFTFTSQPTSTSINYNIKSSDQQPLNTYAINSQSTAVDYNYNNASQITNNNILTSNNEPTVYTYSSNAQQDVSKKQTQSFSNYDSVPSNTASSTLAQYLYTPSNVVTQATSSSNLYTLPITDGSQVNITVTQQPGYGYETSYQIQPPSSSHQTGTSIEHIDYYPSVSKSKESTIDDSSANVFYKQGTSSRTNYGLSYVVKDSDNNTASELTNNQLGILDGLVSNLVRKASTTDLVSVTKTNDIKYSIDDIDIKNKQVNILNEILEDFKSSNGRLENVSITAVKKGFGEEKKIVKFEINKGDAGSIRQLDIFIDDTKKHSDQYSQINIDGKLRLELLKGKSVGEKWSQVNAVESKPEVQTQVIKVVEPRVEIREIYGQLAKKSVDEKWSQVNAVESKPEVQTQVIKVVEPRVEIREVYVQPATKSVGEKWTQVSGVVESKPEVQTQVIKVVEPRVEIREVYVQPATKSVGEKWTQVSGVVEPKPQPQIQIIERPKTPVIPKQQLVSPSKTIIRTIKPVDEDVKLNTKVKKTITYTYLDNYEPSTRIYTLDNENSAEDLSQIPNYFNKINLKDDDATDLYSQFNQPFIKPIDEYTTLINTGLKSNDYVQIHPLLTDHTKITKLDSQNGGNQFAALPSTTRPVLLDSSGDLNKYNEEISKHFGGLKVIDFPVYVQGLELRQTSEGNTSINNSFVRPGIQNDTSAHYIQQANDSDNVHFIRVNDIPH